MTSHPLALGGPGPGCSIGRLRRLAAGELTGDARTRLEEHLAGCARCQASCDSLKRTLALCRASGPTTVPSPVQDAVRQALAALAETP
ncbi:MAG TPA: zf-HC2 domain-containing protein [Anaeromyxobacteraceae bacterium]|nr:zf-HC2 domain-containing protein [Anaeromyxobacteraceae bacterium]